LQQRFFGIFAHDIFPLKFVCLDQPRRHSAHRHAQARMHVRVRAGEREANWTEIV